MAITITQVDAFTARPFAGNPAGVCILAESAPEAWMQQMAAERNLPATAFLHRREGGFALRWFTATVELELCGHATLASAHVLWETGAVPAGVPIVFHTQSGVLTASRDGAWIRLDFPAQIETATEPPAGLVEALGMVPEYVGKCRLDYLIALESEARVRDLKPDMAALGRIDARGIIVTARSEGGEYDFVSRFFAPSRGIPEDSVTGSAHCCLAPYWAGRLGRSQLTGYQASARGGVVRVEVRGDRVLLGGQAVTVMRGELAVVALPAS